MKRCIFSLYVEIKNYEEDRWTEKNKFAKDQFSLYHNFLTVCQKKYADKVKADYILFTDDENYKKYKLSYDSYMSEYNIVNFYKIHLLYKLAEQYDEIIYLDMDVLPFTNENMFDLNFKQNGIAIRVNHEKNPEEYIEQTNSRLKIRRDAKLTNVKLNLEKQWQSRRSPLAKYWNCRAMLIESNLPGDNDVYNTGIIGTHKENLKKLAYFDNFNNDIQLMHSLVTNQNMWPEDIHLLFGYDNETLFSYKMICNKVKRLDLDEDWHYVMFGRWSYIPDSAKLVHIINKDFQFAKEKYEKNNL